MVPNTWASVHEPVLGTRLSLRIGADHADAAAAAELAVLSTCDRLEAVLSAYRPSSPWNRWRRGELDDAPTEVAAVLALAADWFGRSDGAFNPQAGVLRARWLNAADEGKPPTTAEMAELAASIAVLPYTITRDGDVVRRASCEHLDLHAIAKGWVVDRAVEAGFVTPGVTHVTVNLGGDLRHVGEGTVTVGIDDPRTPYDNAQPLARVALSNSALATGSGARRPFHVGGVRYTHVLDPRTGMPAQHVLSATAIAPTCADADAMATVAGVLAPNDARHRADHLEGCAVTVLDAGGRTWASLRWPTT